jgi:hypothetical protein
LEPGEADAVKRHWRALTVEERLLSLRFSDRALVDKTFGIQQVLYHNELVCYHSGIHFLDTAGTAVISMGLRMFRFRWPGEEEGGAHAEKAAAAKQQGAPPEALAATRDFVESKDFFEYIEGQLRSPLMHNRPVLRQDMWPTILEPAPNSWDDYERRVLRLVELALVKSYQESGSSAKPPASAAQEVSPCLEPEAAAMAIEGESKASKAPSKKARKRAAARARKEEEEEEDDGEEKEEAEGENAAEERGDESSCIRLSLNLILGITPELSNLDSFQESRT